jgi:OTU domain-containing protein 3
VSIFEAASDSSSISNDICQARNAALRLQLQRKQLKLVNVQGDGNCWFRAVSVNICGHENQHSELRRLIANHMPRCKALRDLSGSDVETMRKCQQRASAMMRDKVWAGEDVILAAADYLQRDIHVFIAAEQASPLVYSAGVTALPPVRIAFTEPGHYQAVLDMDITRVSAGQYLN